MAPFVLNAVLVTGYAAVFFTIRARQHRRAAQVFDAGREEVPSIALPTDPAGQTQPSEWAWAQARLSIYGSAMLWAVVHPWPGSIPLVVLGLGLGWLALRTQSLIGPMVCHALFNSIACLVLYWGT